MSERYQASEALLERALKVIPLGSQTFSKSLTQYPRGVSPFFLQRGQGAHVWDVDGNRYLDFVNALACVTLGYADPDVDNAVRAQLENGVSFTLAHPLEVDVAELLVEMVPSAEQVRFGKNGSDATSAAIRVARAHTGRDRIAVCGYHGWHDWYIGSTARHLGVPKAVRDLTHSFPYNDLNALDALLRRHPGEFAAVIMEPMNVSWPAPGYLEGVKALAQAHGALLIFDETITGFRYHNGGAQALFGVTPDLSTFGKGLANGYPVSAIVGRADVMRVMEDIFFSGTFGGETLSLAAAKAVLTKLQREPVITHLNRLGEQLGDGVKALIDQQDLGDVFDFSGHPTWTFLLMKDAHGFSAFDIKTLYLQELFAQGILSLGTHNLSYAHTSADVQHLLNIYADLLPRIAQAARHGELRKQLRCEPLQPLFKVR